MLPPRWVRRVVLAPAVVVLTVVVLGTLPLWLLVAAALSPVLPGARWRLLRVLWLVVLHLLLESALLVALAVLWVASGFGARLRTPRFERLHYDLVEVYLGTMYRESQRVLQVEVVVTGPEPSQTDGRPLVVLSRHAGPGDSFLLVHALTAWYDREPRIVLKDTLQWDPAVDVLLGRLPNRFIRPNPGRDGERVEAQVAELARGLDDDDALLIFPEGGNVTAARRARAVERLRDRGLIEAATRAERLRHLMAPRPGGVVAALGEATEADVLWVAHAGLDHLRTAGDVWRALPTQTRIEMHWWQVPADEVPREREEVVEWLSRWWERIDDWVDQQETTRVTGTGARGPTP